MCHAVHQITCPGLLLLAERFACGSFCPVTNTIKTSYIQQLQRQRQQRRQRLQIVIKAVLGMETSADRAYRHYNPAPSAASGTTRGSKLDSAESGNGGSSSSRSGSGTGRDGEEGGAKKSSSSSPGFTLGDAGNAFEIGTFSDGISGDQTLSGAAAAADSSTTEKSPSFSPRQSSHKSDGSIGEDFSAAGRAGSGAVRRRSWSSRQDCRCTAAVVVKRPLMFMPLRDHSARVSSKAPTTTRTPTRFCEKMKRTTVVSHTSAKRPGY